MALRSSKTTKAGIQTEALDLDFTIGMDEKIQEWKHRGINLLQHLFDNASSNSSGLFVLCCYGFAGIVLKQVISRFPALAKEANVPGNLPS